MIMKAQNPRLRHVSALLLGILALMLNVAVVLSEEESELPFIWGGILWNPDSSLVAVSTSHGLMLHNAKLEFVRELGDADIVYAMNWSPDGSNIAASYYEVIESPEGKQLLGYIRIWDVTSGRLIHTVLAHSHRIDSLKWTADGERIVSVGWDRVVRIWSTDDWTLEGELFAGQNLLITNDLDVSPDSRLLVVWVDKEFQIYRLDGLALSREWPYQKGHTAFSWSSIMGFDLNWIATATDDGILVWEVNTGAPIALLRPSQQESEAPCCKSIDAVAWNPDATRIAGLRAWSTQPLTGQIYVWDLQRALLLAELEGCRTSTDQIIDGALDWSPDGRFITCAGSDGRIISWETETFEIAAEYNQYRSILVDTGSE
jgi:dipeptidyl aminopeptidase/acylaminoacyl peptidase